MNPVAGLLTWASLNLLGGGNAVQDEVRKVRERVFTAADLAREAQVLKLLR